MVARYTLGHVRALVGEQLRPDQLVSVVDGVIEEIRDHPGGLRADVDGAGALCLPGLVDLHSDALAKEHRPRPGASLPLELALQAAESNLLAAGVTTAFHAVSFQAKSPVGIPIGSQQAGEVQEAIANYPAPRLDHRVLHRLDVRCRAGVAMFRARLEGATGLLVSYEDHTPGQGQYRDRTVMERWLRQAQQLSAAAAVEHVDRLLAERELALPVRAETLRWLTDLAAAGTITLMGHDPVTVQEVDELLARHARIAEFPTTLAAARHAAARGVTTVAGAPNVLLGGSHSGNVAARELAAAGVLDVLASDYLPSSLLPAAFALAEAGHLSLPAAVALISATPAAAVGLHDRGVLAPGYRADLLLCDDRHARPRVLQTRTAA